MNWHYFKALCDVGEKLSGEISYRSLLVKLYKDSFSESKIKRMKSDVRQCKKALNQLNDLILKELK